ncbi:SWIM zinc finger family protein [Dongshaea marina]|uniref:SWIM zinc finger family protein n=1 Tax=Dongshaea marina TaxID=2047966 RepID=UPI000D3E3470|nr:SWIM zinc finger family protein [Dongshaea marina]
MIKLNEVTKRWLKAFAGEKIYLRGEKYFQSGMVLINVYQSEIPRLDAEVSGSYGNYEVSIEEQNGNLHADCDCPYDGYPCKHVVAVLLDFLERKAEYTQSSEETRGFLSDLKRKLKQYSNEQLIDIIISAAKQNPEFRKELAIVIEPENEAILGLLQRQLNYINLDDIDDDFSSELEKIRELKKILSSAEGACGKTKVIINWEVADKILNFLNSYGIADERWEGLAIQAFDTLALSISQNKDLDAMRQEVIGKLGEYLEWGNCGMEDWILELIDKLS